MKYRAIVYGENAFWRFTNLCESAEIATIRAKNIIKKYHLKEYEIVIVCK